MDRAFLLVTAFAICVLNTQTPGWSADAAIGLDQKEQKFHPGDTVTLSVNLNEPLPKDEFLEIRLSPSAGGELLQFRSGESGDTARTKFRITGKLPDEAIPGKWHVDSVLMFGSAGFSNNAVKSNELSFEVEGKRVLLPTSAEIKIDR